MEEMKSLPITDEERSRVCATLKTVNQQDKKQLAEELKRRGFITRTIDLLAEAVAKIIKFFTGKEINLGNKKMNDILKEIKLKSQNQNLERGIKL